MEDIAPELLNGIQKDYREGREKDKELNQIRKLTAAGAADGKDLDKYAVRSGELLAEALHNNVSGDVLPNGKMYFNIAEKVLPPVLEENHKDVADISVEIQNLLNKKAGIGIKAIYPELNGDRIDGLVNLAASADLYESIRKLLEQDIINFSQSTATDSVKRNADYQYRSGLSPRIVRTAESGCCKWCQALEGTYWYADVNETGNDVWRRHRDCRCVVEYDAGNGKTQNAHSKKWSWKEDNRKKIDARKNYGAKERVKTFKGNRQVLKLAKQGNIYVVKSEKLYENSLKIQPIDGFEDFVAHGDPYSIVFKDSSGNETNISAKEFGDILEANGYDGQRMRLIACQTGAGEGLVPTYIADRFNTEVLAPTEIVNVDFDGNMLLANDDDDVKMGIETGEWVLFGPNGRIKAWSSSDDTTN